ncbi:MAG: hypothetical protein EOO07_31720 [Chitinophagaceae bacterium]|nr:MAG: hypothetical protein EOO07_31720 [Chitinophagaceae bacterium]
MLLILCLFSCIQDPEIARKKGEALIAEKEKANAGINALLDSLNSAAAQADYKTYFKCFTANATYNGTDATENWTQQTFMLWAKPYFDAKTTWNFKSVKRNIYRSEAHDDIAWFDELLSTQMKICRGSGVVIKEDGKWKIQQYVLSMTIPNSKLDEVVKIKTAEEDLILHQLKK